MCIRDRRIGSQIVSGKILDVIAELLAGEIVFPSAETVSYTHLDVYKRQAQSRQARLNGSKTETNR